MADLWWVDSGWKVGVDKEVPTQQAETMDIGLAANEVEAVQLVVTPRQPLRGFRATAGDLSDGRGHTLPSSAVEILRVEYVRVTQTTDKSSQPGLWPDPLPPLTAPLDLPPDINQPLWLRVTAPRDLPRPGCTPAGWSWRRRDGPPPCNCGWRVFGFTLPDRLTCQTALGFSPGNVFRYHGLKTESDRRSVLARYWDSFARHASRLTTPPRWTPSAWSGRRSRPPASKVGRLGERPHGDQRDRQRHRRAALFDDRTNANYTVSFRRDLPVKPGSLRLAFHYRTAVPGSEAMVSLKHYDNAGRWMRAPTATSC
ncbi:MAG: hypothetical protein U1F77_07990 [Kiritimatiellia bacterium]